MMKPRTSKLLAAVLLATSSSSSMKGVEGKPNTLSKPLKPNGKPTPVTTTTEEEEVYTPIDLSALADSVETTTTTSSTRTAAWGTMAATTTTTTTTTKALPTTEPTAGPTVGPTTSPSAAPTPVPTTLTPSLSPTKRIMRKADILPLCQPSLTIATTFDIDNSSALNQHEFSQFIESTTGSSAATVILTSASDQLYQELRKGCVKVFKMPESCYDETTTSDDDDVTSASTALDNEHNNGKFDTLEDSTYVHDGVMLVGFHKGWESKEKVEKKYEEFFCKKLMEFYVENDVELDWTLVDGPSLPVVEEEEEEVVVVVVEEDDGNSTMIDDLEASSTTNNSTVDTFNITDMEVFNDTDIVFNNTEVDSNNTDVMDWSAIANLVVEAAEAAEEAETTTAASTTTASTTTTISAEAVQEEEEEEEENATNNNTASGINAADTSFIQAINQQQQSDSSSPSLDKIPLGGWIGIGLGGVLFVFLLVALLVSKKRRHNNSRNANAVVVENNNNNNNDDNDSIWSDDDYEVTNMNMMMQGAGKGSSSSSSPMSGVAAIGMASTVATRLTTGDTEVTLMKKQVWTEREPVV